MYCSRVRDFCSHGRTTDIDGIKTCYNKTELLLIAGEIERIYGRELNFKKHSNVSQLWKDIAAYMKSEHNCLDELCWVETLKLQSIEKTAFKPKLPNEWLSCDKNFAPDNNCMNTWLSNYEIDAVLKQFEMNIEYFDYLGSVPIDFANLPDKKINNLNIKNNIQNKKTKIGMVFNTDPSTRGGQHWICAFIDLDSKEINFFDSYGSGGVYPDEIEDLFKKIKLDASKNNINLTIKKNTIRHQHKNSECGVYCIKFIADRLSNSFEKLVEIPIPDEIVNKERWNRFFRTETCRPEKLNI